MNLEHNIRNEEVGRSWKSEVGSPKMAEASPLPPPIEGGQERAISNNRAVSIAPDISGQAVGLSQRNRKHDINKRLQPHNLKMWLKPVSLFSISFRRLKPTAIEEKEFQQFSINTGTFLTPPSGVGGLPFYQANRKLGLPADNFFNN